MTAPGDFRLLSFYATPPHPCSYLGDRDAVTVFADPSYPKSIQLYSVLSRYGFRRSGQHVYRPRCSACSACVPVRLPVDAFKPNRAQRRIWKKNRDLTVQARPARYSHEHYTLYTRYLAARHSGGGMDNPSPKGYLDFLTSQWSDTVFYEFRLDERLLGVTVADCLDDGLSAVYTFFDPEHGARSLGVFAVLLLTEITRASGLPLLYLGYWVRGCRKMSYKAGYQPLEYLVDGAWTRDTPDPNPAGAADD